MRLFSLSGNPKKPCFIMHVNDVTIMLDCGLDMSSLMKFLPIPLIPDSKIAGTPITNAGPLNQELKDCGNQTFIDSSPEFKTPLLHAIDISEIDIVIISNYQSLLALPFLFVDDSFNGHVLATEPTKQFGRLCMEELVEYIERSPKLNNAQKWKMEESSQNLPPFLRDLKYLSTWKKCYDKDTVKKTISRIQAVSFREKLNILDINLMAVSSGYALGSSNWMIQTTFDKFAYLSSTSALTSHPKPMDIEPLQRSDVLILTGLTSVPGAEPDDIMSEIFVSLKTTLQEGGNVLMPCNSSGLVYDLLDVLPSNLSDSGLGNIPIYFISPISNDSLAHANIYADWLASKKESRVYLPESPFPHANLVKKGRLKLFKSLDSNFCREMKTPCIVLAGHPSLRFGDAVHFVSLWSSCPLNSIVFTEPDYNHLEALAPFQPVRCKTFFCPIDISLTFSQANLLISRDLQPLHIVVPEQYMSPPMLHPHKTEHMLNLPSTSARKYTCGTMLSIPIKSRYQRLLLSHKFANSLKPTEILNEKSVATAAGQLVVDENGMTIELLESKMNVNSSVSEYSLYGKVNVTRLLASLNDNGLVDARVENIEGGSIVHLPKEDTLIQLDQNSTHIICEAGEGVRIKVKDILIKCLSKF